jgi:hypothetical protein
VSALVVVSLLAAASALAASFPEPDGFGKAKFGMTEAQVKSLYPHLQFVTLPTPLPGQTVPFAVPAYRLDNQSLGPLQGCRVEFRFFRPAGHEQGELYEVQFLCPDKEQATDYLQRQFGLATSTTPSSLTWEGAHAAITLVPKGGVFSFDDRARSQAMQQTLFAYMLKMQLQTPGPTAAATGQSK